MKYFVIIKMTQKLTIKTIPYDIMLSEKKDKNYEKITYRM